MALASICRETVVPVALAKRLGWLGVPWFWVAFSVLPLLFAARALVFAGANSQTYDEAAYLAAGYAKLAGQAPDLMPEHPPLAKELAAVPVYVAYHLPFTADVETCRRRGIWAVSRDFLYDSGVPADDILFLARLPNLVLGTTLVAVVSWWAYRGWGRGGAILAGALAAFDPNLVAHSGVATSDIGTALFVTLTLYLLWEYASSPQIGVWFAAAASAGLASATKYSGLFVLGFLLLAPLLPLGPGLLPRGSMLATGGSRGLRAMLARAVCLTGAAVVVIAVVLALCYFGQGPLAWADGIRLQLNHQRQGHAAFYLGQYSLHGWWSYFPVAVLLKTPLVSLALIAATFVWVRLGSRWRIREVVFLLLPAAVFFLAMMFIGVNIGLRYVLPIYPLLFVACGRLASIEVQPAYLVPAVLATAIIGTAVSSLSCATHELAYFNELIGGPGQGYRYLSDSNIDWGQDLKGLKWFMEREEVDAVYLSYFGTAPPPAYGIHAQYLPGYGWADPDNEESKPCVARLPRQLLAISVVNLQGVFLEDKAMYAWLVEERSPIAKIGYSIYIYDVTDDAKAHRQLAEIYEMGGWHDLAQRELAAVRAAAAPARKAVPSLRTRSPLRKQRTD